MKRIINIAIKAVAIAATCALLGTAATYATEEGQTSLQDYAQMNPEQKWDVVKRTTLNVSDEFEAAGNLERALCSASLFHDTEKGNTQLSSMKGILNVAVERQMPQTAEQVVSAVIEQHFCPQ